MADDEEEISDKKKRRLEADQQEYERQKNKSSATPEEESFEADLREGEDGGDPTRAQAEQFRRDEYNARRRKPQPPGQAKVEESPDAYRKAKTGEQTTTTLIKGRGKGEKAKWATEKTSYARERTAREELEAIETQNRLAREKPTEYASTEEQATKEEDRKQRNFGRWLKNKNQSRTARTDEEREIAAVRGKAASRKIGDEEKMEAADRAEAAWRAGQPKKQRKDRRSIQRPDRMREDTLRNQMPGPEQSAGPAAPPQTTSQRERANKGIGVARPFGEEEREQQKISEEEMMRQIQQREAKEEFEKPETTEDEEYTAREDRLRKKLKELEDDIKWKQKKARELEKRMNDAGKKIVEYAKQAKTQQEERQAKAKKAKEFRDQLHNEIDELIETKKAMRERRKKTRQKRLEASKKAHEAGKRRWQKLQELDRKLGEKIKRLKKASQRGKKQQLQARRKEVKQTKRRVYAETQKHAKREMRAERAVKREEERKPEKTQVLYAYTTVIKRDGATIRSTKVSSITLPTGAGTDLTDRAIEDALRNQTQDGETPKKAANARRAGQLADDAEDAMNESEDESGKVVIYTVIGKRRMK